MRKSSEHVAAGDGSKQAPQPKRRASKAVVLATPTATGLPALFERVASAANFDVDALTKLMALKREIEAGAERRAFDQDFAALQADNRPGRGQRLRPSEGAGLRRHQRPGRCRRQGRSRQGFRAAYDAEPSAVAGAVNFTVKLMRNGVERSATDGAGMRGMSAPQAYGSAITYGRKLGLTLMSNLTVSTPQRPIEPRPERQQEESPPWDAPPRSDEDHLAILKRAAAEADKPPSDKQIEFLADLMRQRGEPASAVLGGQGRLSSRETWQAIDARRAVRP